MNKRLALSGIFFVIAVSCFFAYYIPNLKFNYVFEDFFPTDDPELTIYKNFQENFGDDNNYLLIALPHDPTIFDTLFLQNIETLSEDLKALYPSEEVRSILDVSIPIITPTGMISLPVIHPDDPEKLSSDSVRIYQNSWIPENWIAQDASSLLLFVYHDSFKNKDDADGYLQSIELLLEDNGFTDYYMAGKVYAQHVYVTKMQEELVIFLSLSVLLVMGFLYLIYRSLWSVVVPLIVVGLSVIWLAGFMSLTGKSLDLLMVLMPTILFVVGMSDVVHILSKYLEELRNGKTKLKSLAIAIREIGLATFLTSLTTSVGFITLMTASIKPVREFGLYISIGVFFAYIIAFTLLPSILFFLKSPKITSQQHLRQKWNRYLGNIFIWVFRHQKTLAAASLGLIVISAIGITQIEINTYLIEDLPENDPLKRNFQYFDQSYGGSRPLETTVSLKDSNYSMFEPEVIIEINKVEQILSEYLPASFLISPVFVTKTLNQAIHGGNPDYFTLPQSQDEWDRLERYIRRIKRRPEIRQMLDSTSQTARITGRMDDIGSSITLEQREKIIEKISKEVDNEIIDVQVTGSSFLIDKNNEYLVRNMLTGLAIAFAVVAIIAGFMFLQWRMVIITILPNILPLIVMAGIMGFFNISLKLSTSMVFTIAFGIAVDDTIHMLSKLRLELSEGKSLLYALKRSYLSTGKAIIITTLILSGGFLILLFSSFGGTFYTGLLVGITLLFAMVIDLTLLPVLLIWIFPKHYQYQDD